jgi:hypothetical protein
MALRAPLLAALLALTCLTPAFAASGASRLVTSLVSTGSGMQGFRGGGLVYGTVAHGGSLVVRDLAPGGAQAAQVDVRCGKAAKPVRCGVPVAAGTLYRAAGKVLRYKVSGTRYRVVLRGQSTLDGVGVYGGAVFSGTGSFTVDGGAAATWTTGVIELGGPNSPASPPQAPGTQP